MEPRLARKDGAEGELPHGGAATAELLAHIGEVEARKLHLEAACPSMFRYCTDILGMSGAQSYRRIDSVREGGQYKLHGWRHATACSGIMVSGAGSRQ